jgi:4a-hydroxytetrahydrobiopterin dehydratase
MDTITPQEFRDHDGVEQWNPTASGAFATFETGDFATGARLFSQIAVLADAADHHPDVDVRYATLRVRLFTHSAKGLTEEDAALAARISLAAHDMHLHATADDARDMA